MASEKFITSVASLSDAPAGTPDTLLDGGIDDSTGTVVVTALPDGVTVAQFRIRVDAELMLVSALGGGGSLTWTVTRGIEGSTATTHDDAAGVYLILTGSGLEGLLTGHAMAPSQLDVPVATSPSQTGEGRLVWDSDDDILTVGDGASRKSFGYLGATAPSAPGTASNGSGNEVARATHVHPFGDTPVLLATLTPTGTTADFTSIPGTYTTLEIEWQARSSAAGLSVEEVLMRFNNDSGSNYDYGRFLVRTADNLVTADAAAATSIDTGRINAATAPASYPSGGRILIPNYAGTTFYKNAINQHGHIQGAGAGSGNLGFNFSVGWWRSTAAISRVTLVITGNFVSGSIFKLWGHP